MCINTGDTLISVGKVYVVGEREAGIVKSVMGLYVKDVYGEETLYNIKAKDAARIIKDFVDGRTVVLPDGVTKNNTVTEKELCRLSFDEVAHMARIESNYNFTVRDF